jgi:hypothetical protein
MHPAWQPRLTSAAVAHHQSIREWINRATSKEAPAAGGFAAAGAKNLRDFRSYGSIRVAVDVPGNGPAITLWSRL